MRLIDADIMRENLEWCKSESGRYNDIYWDDVIERLDVQPTVDAAPVVHGSWELVDAAEPQRYGCSKCLCLSWYGTYRFCPNCGAKMDLEEQDADNI